MYEYEEGISFWGPVLTMFLAVIVLMSVLAMAVAGTRAGAAASEESAEPSAMRLEVAVVEIARYREVGMFSEDVVYLEIIGDIRFSLCRKSIPLYVSQRSGAPVSTPHCVRLTALEVDELLADR